MIQSTQILDYINKEISEYDKDLEQNPYYAKKMDNVYELIDCYVLSKYRDESLDTLGIRNPFYNIVSFPLDVSAKMLDFDTRDIKLIAQDENYDLSWIVEKELHYWLKDNNFSYDLNEYSYFLPKDGHLVVKKAKGKIQKVPIRNLRFRPDLNSRFDLIPVVELHYYDSDEFENEKKNNGWANGRLEGATHSSINIPNGKYLVYEYWSPFKTISNESNYFVVTANGDIIADAYLEKSPYKGTYWEKMESRTAGRGQVEKLFDDQIYLNRIANYKSEGLHWSSKHLFQTRDTSIGTNLLYETENGDILRVNSEVNPVENEERNLSFYNYEESRWENNITKRTFSSEPVSGGNLKQNVPYRSSMLSAQMSGTYYKQKRDILAEFIKEIMYDWILPEFSKQTSKEHQILVKNLLDGSDSADKLFKMMVNDKMNKITRNQYLTPEQRRIRRAVNAELIKKGKLEIPKGIYNNLKYKLDIVISGDEIDSSKIQMYDKIVTSLLQNPTALQDKRVIKILNEELNMLGISPFNINLDNINEGEELLGNILMNNSQNKAQRGGSVAAIKSSIPNNITTQTAV